MCNNTFNIKVVEGNEFPIILRLQALSYEAVPPIAEPIDYTRLTDCVFKVGGVQYNIEITEDGVRAIMPATLALGDYNVEFTAKYDDSDIRAAYLRAITIVKWNGQSNAGECLLGSPVVLPAAIVIGGTLTDAELEELKEEMREKNAQLAQAIEDAEAAKAEWERKAAELDDVAQQSTLTQGVQTLSNKIDNINIDTSDLAKEATAQEILQKVSVGADAYEAEVQAGKVAIVEAIEDKGGTASTDMTMNGLAQAIDSIQVPTQLRLNAVTFENSANNPIIDMGAIEVVNATTGFNLNGFGAVEEVRNLPPMPYITSLQYFFSNTTSLKKIVFGNRFNTSIVTNWLGLFAGSNIKELDMSSLNSSNCTDCSRMFINCTQLEKLDIRNFHFAKTVSDMFQGVVAMREIDMRNTDAAGLTSFMFYGFPIYSPNLTTLVGDATYEEVVDNDIRIYNGVNVNMNTNWGSSIPNLNRASIRALINGLADRTGQSALTLTIGASQIAKLSAEDIAVATNKNWTLA